MQEWADDRTNGIKLRDPSETGDSCPLRDGDGKAYEAVADVPDVRDCLHVVFSSALLCGRAARVRDSGQGRLRTPPPAGRQRGSRGARRKRSYNSIAYGFEAGVLISQILQQGIKYPLAEAMDATTQRPQLRNLG